jgi:hypothetical protein
MCLLAALLLGAALGCAREIRLSRTLEQAAPWLALLAVSVTGSATVAILAGGAS